MKVESISQAEIEDISAHVEHKVSLYDAEYRHEILLEIGMNEYLLIEAPPNWSGKDLKISRLKVEGEK